MSINVTPSSFDPLKAPLAERTEPRILNADERESLLRKAPNITIEGDVFTYEGVRFSRLGADALRNEHIDLNGANLSLEYTTRDPVDHRVVIALRDPEAPENVLLFKVDRQTVEKLSNAFGSGDFYLRQDGILRLNGTAEEYVAGWLLDIRRNRGYEAADVDGNGTIDSGEEGALRIGFDHRSEYDYLEENVVAMRNTVGSRRYMNYADTYDYMNIKGGLGGAQEVRTQVLGFERTIEKELNRTLMVDADSDGTITLHEGLQDKALGETPVEEVLLKQVQNAHKAWIRREDPDLKPNAIFSRKLGFPDIMTEEERTLLLEAMLEQAKTIITTNYEQIQHLDEAVALELLLDAKG